MVLFCLMTVTAAADAVYITAQNQKKDDLTAKKFASIYIPEKPLDFAADLDSIHNTECLKGFFTALDSLRAGKDTVVTVIQIGDSHIQPGYLTARVRQLMQESFGNAGRGLLIPLRLAHTNGPEDYTISSGISSWIGGRCIQANPKTRIGVGGIGIKTSSDRISFTIHTSEKDDYDRSFNRVVAYRCPESATLEPDDDNDVAFTAGHIKMAKADVCVDTFYAKAQTNMLKLHSDSSVEGEENLYFGFNVTNGHSGVLYHSIGVNGATYANYTDVDYVRQLALLNPSLLIISLGTNETFGRHFNPDDFESQISEFLSIVKKEIPGAAVILATPAECYKRMKTRVRIKSKRKRKRYRSVTTFVRNTFTEQAAEAIANIAHQDKVAYWDMFNATGGEGSCSNWQGAGLFTRDRVHFTPQGYEHQGTLLFRALMSSYTKYSER